MDMKVSMGVNVALAWSLFECKCTLSQCQRTVAAAVAVAGFSMALYHVELDQQLSPSASRFLSLSLSLSLSSSFSTAMNWFLRTWQARSLSSAPAQYQKRLLFVCLPILITRLITFNCHFWKGSKCSGETVTAVSGNNSGQFHLMLGPATSVVTFTTWHFAFRLVLLHRTCFFGSLADEGNGFLTREKIIINLIIFGIAFKGVSGASDLSENIFFCEK